MTKLSKHFDSEEFACKCCGKSLVKSSLVELLEKIRSVAGLPITITSGYRCKKHNAAVGGAKNSQHVQGIAADIKIKGMTPKQVADIAKKLMPKSGGIGIYETWCHVDTRATRARWKA